MLAKIHELTVISRQLNELKAMNRICTFMVVSRRMRKNNLVRIEYAPSWLSQGGCRERLSFPGSGRSGGAPNLWSLCCNKRKRRMCGSCIDKEHDTSSTCITSQHTIVNTSSRSTTSLATLLSTIYYSACKYSPRHSESQRG
jgi:hypothetical protein